MSCTDAGVARIREQCGLVLACAWLSADGGGYAELSHGGRRAALEVRDFAANVSLALDVRGEQLVMPGLAPGTSLSFAFHGQHGDTPELPACAHVGLDGPEGAAVVTLARGSGLAELLALHLRVKAACGLASELERSTLLELAAYPAFA